MWCVSLQVNYTAARTLAVDSIHHPTHVLISDGCKYVVHLQRSDAIRHQQQQRVQLYHGACAWLCACLWASASLRAFSLASTTLSAE